MPCAGDVIADKYVIDGILGRGGTSIVYRATHRQLEQEVAIKVLCDAAASKPEYVTRLQREARMAACLRSEHVVRIFDIGEVSPGRNPYVVMECLSGSDLGATLARRGSLSVPVAVECMLQITEALAEAHAHGIVHRDLKPANIFLVDNVVGRPRIKVLDFGISRAVGPDLPGLTDPGIALGTPSYMAPEQMEASPRVDARSDIWALGAILYELLVGHPPFRGTTLPQIFVNILRSKTPRPSESRRDVPVALDAIVQRCLTVDPAGRFASAAEVARALSALGRACPGDSFDGHGTARSLDGPREVTLPSVAVSAPARMAPAPSSRLPRAALAGAFVVALILGGLVTAIGMSTLGRRAASTGSHAGDRRAHTSVPEAMPERTPTSGAAAALAPVAADRDGAMVRGAEEHENTKDPGVVAR